MSRARVVLAEDHAAMAEQLRELLESEFDVIAIVADGDALVTVADALDPDVVVAAISMPKVDGIAATRALHSRRPSIPVVLVTIYADTELVRRGMAAGAMAYVLKLRATDDLVPAVRAALHGMRYLSVGSHRGTTTGSGSRSGR